MHSLLGLSASHLSWLRPCTPTQQLAYQHRGVAFKGLHDAIGNFSRRNSDAVLAASMLLSWQVTDWLVPFLPGIGSVNRFPGHATNRCAVAAG